MANSSVATWYWSSAFFAAFSSSRSSASRLVCTSPWASYSSRSWFGEPAGERAFAGRGDRVRLGRARPGLTGAHVAPLGQRRELPVDLAPRGGPERTEPRLRCGHQLAAGHRPFMEQPQQGCRCRVETFVRHDSTLPRSASGIQRCVTSKVDPPGRPSGAERGPGRAHCGTVQPAADPEEPPKRYGHDPLAGHRDPLPGHLGVRREAVGAVLPRGGVLLDGPLRLLGGQRQRVAGGEPGFVDSVQVNPGGGGHRGAVAVGLQITLRKEGGRGRGDPRDQDRGDQEAEQHQRQAAALVPRAVAGGHPALRKSSTWTTYRPVTALLPPSRYDGTAGTRKTRTTQTSKSAPGSSVAAPASAQPPPTGPYRSSVPAGSNPWSRRASSIAYRARASAAAMSSAVAKARPASRAAWVTAKAL